MSKTVDEIRAAWKQKLDAANQILEDSFTDEVKAAVLEHRLLCRMMNMTDEETVQADSLISERNLSLQETLSQLFPVRNPELSFLERVQMMPGRPPRPKAKKRIR